MASRVEEGGRSPVARFVAELRRRRVFRVAVVYAAVGWVIVEVASTTFPMVGMPSWTPELVLLLVVIGFPLAVGLAWAFQTGPGGLRVDGDDGPATAAPSFPTRVPEALTGVAALPPGDDPRPGLVVLPFDNLSPDSGDAYFCEGLTEELTADLSAVRSLRVISRTSAMQLKGSGKDVPTIGRELGVRYVLEGSVRKAGDRLRVTAQLIEATADAHLWSERYDGELGDVFGIQEEISRAIACALRLELTAKEDQGLADRPIPDVRAYELYLRARQRTLEWTPQALDRARQELLTGLEIVGPNALFYAGLAYVYWHYVNLGVENDEYIAEAEAYASRALELDPGSGEAHLVLGLLDQAFRGDQRSSIRHFLQALDRNPDDPHAVLWLAVGYTLVGRSDDAVPLARRMLQVDPLNPVSQFAPTFVDVWAGRLEHSPEELRTWHTLDPDNPANLFFSAVLLCHCEYRAEARALLEDALSPDFPDVFTRGGMLLLRALRGEARELEEETTGQLEVTGGRDPQFSYLLADIHAVAGLREKALHWLETSVDRGFCNYPFMAEHDSMLKTLRSDPEFERIAARAKTEWLAFDA